MHLVQAQLVEAQAPQTGPVVTHTIQQDQPRGSTHTMSTATEPKLSAGTVQRAQLSVSSLHTACGLMQERKAAACGIESRSAVIRSDATAAHLLVPTADERIELRAALPSWSGTYKVFHQTHFIQPQSSLAGVHHR